MSSVSNRKGRNNEPNSTDFESPSQLSNTVINTEALNQSQPSTHWNCYPLESTTKDPPPGVSMEERGIGQE